jgi:hypothetical protein
MQNNVFVDSGWSKQCKSKGLKFYKPIARHTVRGFPQVHCGVNLAVRTGRVVNKKESVVMIKMSFTVQLRKSLREKLNRGPHAQWQEKRWAVRPHLSHYKASHHKRQCVSGTDLKLTAAYLFVYVTLFAFYVNIRVFGL